MNYKLDRLAQIIDELAGDAAVHSSHATRQAKAQQAYAVIDELRSEKPEPARPQSPVERKVEQMLAEDMAEVVPGGTMESVLTKLMDEPPSEIPTDQGGRYRKRK